MRGRAAVALRIEPGAQGPGLSQFWGAPRADLTGAYDLAPCRPPHRPVAADPAPPAPETPVEARAGEALVWTDGACSGNPGPGGWAAIVVGPDGAEPVELSGGEAHTTNNRMEYTAALEGLRSLPAGATVCIVTDSTLLLDSMTKWIHGWKKKGWKTASGQPVKNQDLVMALEEEIARHADVRWHWVKGHETGAEHAHKALNDRADQLAVAAARRAAASRGLSGLEGGAG